MRRYIVEIKKNLSAIFHKKTALAQSDGSGHRILFVANALIPTLQLSFLKPLALDIEQGSVLTELLTEVDIKTQKKLRITENSLRNWIKSRVLQFKPTVMVFCRYSGPYSDYLTSLAKVYGIPTVFHVDDDLLNVPMEIGAKKYEFHNSPTRIAAVRHLLENVGTVYCSTNALKDRFLSYGFRRNFKVGAIYCAGEVVVPAEVRSARKIGYMGFDHAHDLELVLPALIQVLRKNPEVCFELFGSIPKPPVLDEFGARISIVPPIPNYDEFLKMFSPLNWDVGICPLARTEFNAVKANTKWVEYTSVGIAVVASAGTIYDECCAGGCGALATTTEDWVREIENLVLDSSKRFEQVATAQRRLSEEYSVERLKFQVLDVLDAAR